MSRSTIQSRALSGIGLVVALSLSALLSCNPSSAQSDKNPNTLPSERASNGDEKPGHDSGGPASPASKREILIIGDSMMQFGIGPALKKDLENRGYRVEYFVKKSTGLTWTHFFDWQNKSQELLSFGDFHAIIVMLGSNDGRWLKYQGKRLEYGANVALWWDQYSIRFDEFYGRLCNETDRVFWIGMPPMKPVGYHNKTRLFNDFYERKIRQSGCGRYIPTDYLSKDRPVRWSDGIHVSNSGGRTVAERIVKETGL